jgi:hypothetical protein
MMMMMMMMMMMVVVMLMMMIIIIFNVVYVQIVKINNCNMDMYIKSV